MKVLIVSSGRSCGDAYLSLATAELLYQANPDWHLSLASYSIGYEILKDSQWNVYNIGFTERDQYLSSLFKARDLILEVAPDVVLSYEEYAVLPAASLASVPSIFIGASFPPDGGVRAESLTHASSVIIMQNAGLFPFPKCLTIRPIYVGQCVRSFKHAVTQKELLRREWGLGSSSVILAVLTDGSASEKSTPMIDIVLSAFLGMSIEDRHLYWLSHKDYEYVKSKIRGIHGVNVLKSVEPIERLICMSDVVITKGSYEITMDCAALGVPSISLSAFQSPIDDFLVPRFHNNIALSLRATYSDTLIEYITQSIQRGPIPSLQQYSGVTHATKTIMSEIARIIHV
jgi:hypothetical protein